MPDHIASGTSFSLNSGYSGIITLDADLSVTGDVNIPGGKMILNNGNLVTGAELPSLPPSVATDPALNINGNATVLNATVNPNGSETTVYFEWGMDTNYGNVTTSQNIGSGTGNIVASANINRLSRNTVYHYRAVAVNAQGTSYGDDAVFTTLGGTTVGATTISSNTTWTYAGSPYIINGNISVYGASEPTLTIEPGVDVRFNGLYYLRIGYSSYKGRLSAQGTLSSPIIFTSNNATPAPGSWYGIRFYNHAVNESSLDYVTVEYGGYQYGGFYLSNSSAIIQNSSVKYSSTDGIYLSGDSAPVISNSFISNNNSEGVYVSGTNASVLNITNTTFDNNGSYALDIPVTAGLGSGNVFINSSGIKLTGATITTDMTWSYQTIPYIISQNISVYGTSSEPVLTIEPGVIVKFTGPYYLSVGTSSYKGRLVAQGTSSAPITFTATSLTNGFWYGLRFYKHAAAESILDYVTVEYAGKSYGGIYISGSSPVISQSIVRYNNNSGINITGNSSPVVTRSTISNNAVHGINAAGTGSIEITFSSISDNSQYAAYSTASILNINHCNITGNGNGVYGASGKTSDARLNWWGSPVGPGAFVNQYVDYEPWLGAPYTYPFYNVDISATLQQFNAPGNSVDYTFSISDNSTWDFYIKDPGGNTLKTFSGSGISGVVTWDGKDVNSVLVPDGAYTYQLFSTSQIDSSQSAPLTGDVQVNNILPSAIITYPANNQDLGNALLNIQGTANADYFNNYKVEYGLGADPMVWTLITSSTTPVVNGTLAVWDPLDLTGDYYTIKLTVSDNYTNTSTGMVGVSLLSIHSLDISPLSFSPDGDDVHDMTTITALITYPSDWTMDIKDSGGNIVKSFSGNGTSLSAVWDGKDLGGVILPEGVYSFTITAIEAVSGATSVITGSVSIDFPDPPVVTTNSATDLNIDSATLNAVVNPNGAETTVYFQWGTDTSYGNNTSAQSIGSGTSNVIVFANLTGLSRGVTYHYRAVASNISGTTNGSDMSFITAPQAPSDLTATVITSSQVNFSWTDNSSNESGFKIERKTGAGGTFEQIAIVGTNTTTYSDLALTPETTYFFRVAAYNSIGASAYSNEAEVTPTVLPIVATTSAIYITANTAILTGVINPHGVNTTYYFEWGTTTSYGNTFSGFSTVNGTGDVNVSADLTGLSRDTTYHYRLVASNAYGTAYGNDMTFTTIAGTDVSGVISTDTTWTLAGSPYVIIGDVLVYGTSNPMLTIEPGVVVRIMGYGLFIGTYNWGVLKAQGTSSNPIVFTSNNPDPAPGDWMLIMFGGYSTSESILENVIVEYGGWWGYTGWTSISVSSSTGENLRIKNSTIRFSAGSGIELSGLSSLTLTDSNIVGNATVGLYSNGWDSVYITGSTISDNGGTGIYDRSSNGMTITDSAISNNGEYGVYSTAYDDITIVNSTISSNGNYGVYATTANTNISFSTIENNVYGGVFSNAANLKINHCNITGNDYGIYSAVGKIADARFNWWGDASGPSGEGHGTGQSVDSGINYEPWLGAPFTYPFYNADLTATVQEFSPLNNSAAYTFYISENAGWLFSIRDLSGNAVRSFSGAGTSDSVAWDGTDSFGAPVPDGTYAYQLSSSSLSDSSQSAPVTGDVIINSALPKAEITDPVNGQFISGSALFNIQGTATGSDFKDYKVEYGVGTAPQTWTLIANSAAQINSGALATWNSSSLTGAYYTIRLSVSDLTENTATDIVEVKLFNIYNVAISVPSFSPNGDGYKDASSIGAYLTYPADWIIDVKNSAGAIVRTFSGTGNYFSVGWDGRDASGNIQPAGEYSCTITATEPVSGTTAAVTGNITINLSLPAVITDPATNVADSSALLNATANPNDSPTSVYFQWGTDISYGNNTSQQSAGSGSDNVSISINLTGLSTGIIYHYSAVAVSANGTSYGEDRIFRPNSTTLTGTVTDASTGLPVPNVNVTVTDLSGTYSAVTNQSGVYNLTQVTEGNFTAIFENAGYIGYETNGTLNYNQTLTLNIQLTPVSPLFLDITSPGNGAIVTASPTTVIGGVYNTAGIGGSNEALAQSFKPVTSGLLNKVSLFLGLVGSPTDNWYVRISKGLLNYPNELIAQSSSSSGGNWTTFSFPDPPAISAGETYFVELYREARNTNNYYVWNNSRNINLDFYSDGVAFRRNNGIWEPYCSCDFAFRVYINDTMDISHEIVNEFKHLYGVAPYPATVTVNGIQATVNNHTFSVSVPLTEGSNTITASASDQYNHLASDTINVILSYQPAISNIAVSNITNNSATVTWTTDQPADSLVEYGTTTAYGSSASDASMTTSHSITLTGLTPGTLYHFKVTSTNAYGIPSSSGDNTFTTISPSPPVISNIVVSNITDNSALITWTTDQQADSVVDYGTTSEYGSTLSDPVMVTSHSITLSNLIPGGAYHFRVTSTNGYGLWSSSGDNTFTTTSPITITIVSPVDNDTIDRADVMVRGTVTNSTGNETGVTVNGMVATVYNGQFFVNHVPLEEGQNTIAANAVDTASNTASHSILVNANTTTPHVTLTANIESGIAPLTTYFSLSTSIPNSVSSYSFDYEGDGMDDYTGTAFDNISANYQAEGIYYPTVTVTDDQGNNYTDTIAIIVLNQNDLDMLLRAKWNAMKNALIAEDIATALSYFVEGNKNRYNAIFSQMSSADINSVFSNITEFKIYSINGKSAQCGAIRAESGGTYSYPVTFVIDENGIWKMMGF